MVIVNGNPTQIAIPGLPERTNSVLLEIVRDNINSQYARQTPSLAGFRDAVSTHGGTEDDDVLLADFHAHVPLSDYISYKPFVDRFNVQPCREDDVKNMFSPGFPDFFALSSATSGTEPKILPKYDHDARLKIPPLQIFELSNEGPLALVVCTTYREVKMIERAPGEVVQRIPVCVASGGHVRRIFGWYTDDESRMSAIMPGYCVPWAATVIGHFPSFLIIHGLFFLANKNVYRFQIPFATQFIDLIRHINEHWDVLVSCIRDGILPELEGIEHVREYLQTHFYPNPERAVELLEIGPPFSLEGWFACIWPKVKELCTACGGSFATALPQVRSILGPNVNIRCSIYSSTEARMGVPYADTLDEFVLRSSDIVEFLDVTLDATHESLRRPWEVEVGKEYEPILTTRDGLWRYRLGDVLHIVGFHPESGSPLFKYAGRRSLTIRFPFTQVTDKQLLAVIHAAGSEDGVQVQEFTTVLDDRMLLPTVGFFIELAGPLGPNAGKARQKLFDALAAENSEIRLALKAGKMGLPTIRVVKVGTFTEYRQWKGENSNIVSAQIKVPMVLLNLAVQEWILERVVQEL